MRSLLVTATAIATALLLAACAPTVREQLTMDTAAYTQCGHVEINCIDDDCSNLKGGPWTATACGTAYRCTRTAGSVVCAPQEEKAAPAVPFSP